MDGCERQRLRWTATRPSQSGQELTSGQRRLFTPLKQGSAVMTDVKTPGG